MQWYIHKSLYCKLSSECAGERTLKLGSSSSAFFHHFHDNESATWCLKTVKNRLIFGKDMDNIPSGTFFETQCTLSQKWIPTLTIVTWRRIIIFLIIFLYEYSWHRWPRNDHTSSHLTHRLFLHYLRKSKQAKCYIFIQSNMII